MSDPPRGVSPTRASGACAAAASGRAHAARRGTRRTRGRGLASLDELPPDHALLLEPCRSIHTMGMRFALDLVWLDAAGEPVRVDAAVGPRQVRSCLRARAVVECGAGDGERFAAALGIGAQVLGVARVDAGALE